MHGERSINDFSIARNGYQTRKSRMIGIQRMLRKLRNEGPGDGGFTLVEVMVVTLLFLIILAGIVVLLSGTFDIFKSNRDLLAVTDSSRRALSTMSSELRGALYIDNANSNNYQLAFWADIRGDEDSANIISSNNWTNAPEVTWTRDPIRNVIQQTTREPPPVTTSSTVDLADNVPDQGLKFEYYPAGSDANINKLATMIRITITVQKGKSSRSLAQDVFLRVMHREALVSAAPLEVTGHGSGTVAVTGVNTNFASGRSAISFIPSETWITSGAPTVKSPTQILMLDTVPEASGTPGYFDVNDQTGAGKPFLKVNGFEVG
jgi:prepilin-type N-terminal cleavage/methylation domain-containing protein